MKTSLTPIVQKLTKFIFCIDEKVLHEIRIRAAIRNISMSQWVTRAIFRQIKYERKYEDKKNEQQKKAIHSSMALKNDLNEETLGSSY